jgi:hypothetical protein
MRCMYTYTSLDLQIYNNVDPTFNSIFQNLLMVKIALYFPLIGIQVAPSVCLHRVVIHESQMADLKSTMLPFPSLMLAS